jgi:hypothetical protein
MKCCKIVSGDEATHLNGSNDLRMGMRILRMIEEAGALQPLEMQTQ